MKKSGCILIFLLSFHFGAWAANGQAKPLEYGKLASQLMHNFSRRMAVEKGLKPLTSGGGMMREIYSLSVGYTTCGNVNVEEARALLVSCVEDFADTINKNRQLRPYLHDYPFPPKSIELSIIFEKPNHDYVDAEYVVNVLLLKGTVHYSYYDHEKNGYDHSRSSKEPYEEALRLVKEKGN